MGVSRALKYKWSKFTDQQKRRIVDMGWEDRSAFDDICLQFGLSPNEMVKFMRTQLKPSDYRRWRRRANTQGQLKHRKTRGVEIDRHKCSRQRFDGSTKG
jgi:uncharacterized protein (TIGR03643 family)